MYAEAAFACDPFLAFFDLGVVKFLDLTALEADQVIVMLALV